MSEIYQVLQQLRATSSKTEKRDILQANKGSELLKRYFHMALDPFTTYYMRQIPDIHEHLSTHSLEYAMDEIDRLARREVTGNAARDFILALASKISKENWEVIQTILLKDPDAGVQAKSINTAWPDLIPSYNVMLCSAYDHELIKNMDYSKGVYVQLKADGARVNIVIDETGKVEVYAARSGRPVGVMGRFDYLGKLFPGTMIDGELLVRDPLTGEAMSRKEGNGIVNKAIKGTISQDESASLFVMVWDTVSIQEFKQGKGSQPYDARLKTLDSMVATDTENGLELIPTTLVRSPEEVQRIYKEYRARGLEGTIVKERDTLWEAIRSPKQVKVKAEMDNDLEIIDVIVGKDKLAGIMGAMIAQSSDGKIVVSVGGGYSHQQRAQYWANFTGKDASYVKTAGGKKTTIVVPPNNKSPVGSILPVTHNGKINNGSEWSLYLPRAQDGELRTDKFEADPFGHFES